MPTEEAEPVKSRRGVHNKGKSFGPWVDERVVARLREYNRSTTMSMRDMANALNEEFNLTLTRNSVISKLSKTYRMERPGTVWAKPGRAPLRRTEKPAKKAVVQRITPFRARPLPDVALPFLAEAVESRQETAASGITIDKLTPTTCRWPLGGFKDQPPYQYCGHVPLADKPYCANHHRLSFKPLPPRQ